MGTICQGWHQIMVIRDTQHKQTSNTCLDILQSFCFMRVPIFNEYMNSTACMHTYICTTLHEPKYPQPGWLYKAGNVTIWNNSHYVLCWLSGTSSKRCGEVVCVKKTPALVVCLYLGIFIKNGNIMDLQG